VVEVVVVDVVEVVAAAVVEVVVAAVVGGVVVVVLVVVGWVVDVLVDVARARLAVVDGGLGSVVVVRYSRSQGAPLATRSPDPEPQPAAARIVANTAVVRAADAGQPDVDRPAQFSTRPSPVIRA
jgi:hypothetical protein